MDLGLRLVISLLMGIFGGYWLDRKLHTLPLFLLIGFLFGAFSGFLSIYHTVFSKKQK
ncbi:MAG: AtpZ/AtpI family protein [Calditrichaeota bacterium]|nr:AtpZ/AtpI family protein [Calditrichota bacterium]